MQRKTTVLCAVIMAFTALLIISNVQELYSADVKMSQGCSNEALVGSYGTYRTGTTLDGPIASVSIVKFDANGNMSIKQHTSRNGDLEFGKFTARIQVAADCTVKVFGDDGTQISSGVIVDDGDGFFLLNRNLGATTVLVGRRIHAK